MDEKSMRRFWAKVNKGGPVPEHCPWLGPCWVWTAGGRNGYGRFNVNGTALFAHRVSWEIHSGPIPDGLHVLHRCDNRGCTRPEHLFLGTQTENNSDMTAKGRRASVLCEVDVRVMRRLRRRGMKLRLLGWLFSVKEGTVSRTCSRHTWGHVLD